MLLLLPGCNKRSLDDFRLEGEEVVHSLTQELRKIRTRDQLLKSTGKLQRLFNELTDIMIAAHGFNQKQIKSEKSPMPFNSELNNRLRSELNRIYKIEGGRQIIEKCQEQALHRLDAFEKKLK